MEAPKVRASSDPDRVEDFTVVYAATVERVGPAAALVMSRIGFRCNQAGPGRIEDETGRWWRVPLKTLAAETGLSADQVRRALHTLESTGEVSSTKHHDGGPSDQTMSYRATSLPAIRRNRHIDVAESPNGRSGRFQAANADCASMDEAQPADLRSPTGSDQSFGGIAESMWRNDHFDVAESPNHHVAESPNVIPIEELERTPSSYVTNARANEEPEFDDDIQAALRDTRHAAHPIPPDWTPTPELRARLARKYPTIDIDAQVPLFVAHNLADGHPREDWGRWFEGWCFNATPTPPAPSGPPPAAEVLAQFNPRPRRPAAAVVIPDGPHTEHLTWIHRELPDGFQAGELDRAVDLLDAGTSYAKVRHVILNERQEALRSSRTRPFKASPRNGVNPKPDPVGGDAQIERQAITSDGVTVAEDLLMSRRSRWKT